MKQIITLALILFLVAGCGSSNINENTVSNTEQTTTTNTQTVTCGDGICDDSEMCNVDTLEAGCVDDCGACPSYLYIKGFDCGSYNCKETSDNTFEITGNAEIKMDIVNLGDILANTLEVDAFKCYVGNEKVLSNKLLANYKGYIFSAEGFNGETEVRLSARGTTGDRATYKLSFEKDPKSELETPFELRCTFDISTHNPIEGKDQTVYLKFV